MRVALTCHLIHTCRVGIPTGVSSFQRLSRWATSTKVHIPLCARAFHRHIVVFPFGILIRKRRRLQTRVREMRRDGMGVWRKEVYIFFPPFPSSEESLERKYEV